MYNNKKVDSYAIDKNASVHDALVKITTNKNSIAMVIDGEYHLTGVITNGDILRWMTRQNEPNLKIAVTEIQNTDFLFTTNHSSKSEIKALRKVQYLPVINDQNQINIDLFQSTGITA